MESCESDEERLEELLERWKFYEKKFFFFSTCFCFVVHIISIFFRRISKKGFKITKEI